jgi:GWxTD domain-containing protein
MGRVKWRNSVLIVIAAFLFFPVLSTPQETSAGANREKAIRDSIRKFDESASPYKLWLQQDVVCIITDEERAAFKLLQNDEERDNFIEAFWTRRNPTPESFDNPYKDEHYRRIVYANEHFGTAVPGWKSDRGRMYVRFGPADEVESYSTRTQDKTPGVDPSSYPLEVWHYRYLEGIGEDVVLEFVDSCKCGEYKMPTTLARENDVRTYPTKSLGGGPWGRLEPVAPQPFGLVKTPKIKFKDLEEKANLNLGWKTLPFEVSTDTVKATDFTSVVPITINFQERDLTFVEKDGSRRAGVKIFGRATAITGRIIEIFETTTDVGVSTLPDSASGTTTATFVKILALRKGTYKVEIAAEEVNSDHWGRWARVVKAGEE